MDRIVEEFQDAEIDVTGGIGGLNGDDVGSLGDQTAARGSEIADHVQQLGALVVERIVADLRQDERHAVSFDESQQVLEIALDETVEPGQGTDQTAADRIGAVHPVLCEKIFAGSELLTLTGVADADARDERIEEIQVVRVDGAEPCQNSARLPDDLADRVSGDQTFHEIGQQIGEGIGPGGSAAGAQGLFKILCGLFGARRIIARLDMPFEAQQRIAAHAESVGDGMVFFQDEFSKFRLVGGVSAVRGGQDPVQPGGRQIARDVLV